MSLKLIVIPVAVLFVASLFNPTIIDAQDSGLTGINSTVIIGTNATYSYPSTGQLNSTQCNSVSSFVVNTQNLFIGFYNFIVNGLNLSSQQIQPVTCVAVGISNLTTQFNQQRGGLFYFDPYNQNSALVFVALIGVIITVGVIGGINVISSGLNAGATLILAVGSGLILLWLSLTGNTAITFENVPQPFGGILYVLLTIMYTMGSLELIGGIKSE